MQCSLCNKPIEPVKTKTGYILKRCSHCREIQAKNMRLFRARHGAYSNQYQRDFNLARRKHVIEHYGGRCICCGETHWEFLALDHKDGYGSFHRKTVMQRGSSMVGWIIRNNYPDSFVLRCHNCNQAIGYYGYCPHQREE